MYNMPDLSKLTELQVPTSPVQKMTGLMRRAAERTETDAAYDPTESIISHMRKYRETADLPLEEGSTTGALEEGPKPPNPVDSSYRPMSRPLPVGEGISGDVGGRSAAESYLGRKMDDKEWEMLIRATHAEATGDARERAGVMSVILNRVKSERYPNTITEVLMEPNQFQAVTGTKGDRNPSSRYNSVNSSVISQFQDEVAPLLSDFADKNWLNFTAGNPDAYKEGTDIGFMEQVKEAQGSMQIGGTIFGTVR
jgi:hypothetical protein